MIGVILEFPTLKWMTKSDDSVQLLVSMALQYFRVLAVLPDMLSFTILPGASGGAEAEVSTAGEARLARGAEGLAGISGTAIALGFSGVLGRLDWRWSLRLVSFQRWLFARRVGPSIVARALQSTQLGKPRVAYPTINRLFIHTSVVMKATSLF